MFGVACEALPRQINFLTAEAGDCDKGTNAVVRRIHYFFDNHGFVERDACLHAYNCTGQNKNIYTVQYCVWYTKVGSLADVADVVNKSGECNFAQLVSSTTVAPTHDWSDFFATRMKKVVSIKKLHHFKISSLFPSKVFVKEHSDSGEIAFDVLKGPWIPDTDELPTVILPPGLTPD